MADLRMSPTALEELRQAVQWYSASSDRAALNFAAAVETAMDDIEAHPLRFAWLNDQYRYVQLRRFPYFIAYRVHSGVASIVGVRHTSRKDVEFEPTVEE